MKNVYRVNTFYHLLQCLYLIKRNEYNILLIEGFDLIPVLSNLKKSNLFNEVHYRKKPKRIEKFLCLIISNLKIHLRKKYNIYTCHHSYGLNFSKILSFKNKVYVFEDGYSSYQKIHLNKQNSIFTQNSILSNYYICFKNKSIDFFIYKKRPEFVYENILIKTYDNPEIPKKYFKKYIELIFDIKINLINENSIMILPQPLVEDKYINMNEYKYLIKKIENKIKLILKEDESITNIYLKPHPRQNELSFFDFKNIKIELLNKNLPIEILELYDLKIKYGITFFSTAINSNIFVNKIKLDEK